MHSSRSVLLSAFFSVAAALPAQLSGPYVVGPGGSFANMAAAISALNTSGVSGPVSFLVTANDSGPWTLGAFPGQGPTSPVLFDGQGTVTISGAQPVLTLSGCDSVTFRGFKGSFGSANYTFVVNPGTVGCVFTGCSFLATLATSSTGFALFNLAGGSNIRIEDSSFGGSYEALYVGISNDSSTVQRCVITGGGWWIMRLGGSNFTLVNNFVIGSSNYGISAGVSGLANGPNLRIRHNSVYINHPTAGSQYCSLRWYTTAPGSEVLNNIFYDAYPATGAFNMWGTAKPVTMNYNCFWSNAAGYTPFYSGTNLSLAGWQALGFDVNSIQADPQYVLLIINPPILALQVTSPCATAGTTIPGVKTDYYQALRTTPVSIGAHEVTNGTAAVYATFGGGCAGAAGVPSNTAWPPPQLGAQMQITFGNLPPPNVMAMALGVSNATSGAGPLPLHLGFLNAPGCSLRVSLDFSFNLYGTGGTASMLLPIPSNSGLIGLALYTQGLVLDPGRNGLGAVMSDAAVLRIGF